MPGVLVATGWLLLAPGCSRKESAPAKVDDSSSAAAQEPVATAAFASTLPHVGGPAGYVGSKSCRSCHEDQFDSWHRSYHRTMTQIAAADTIQADFHNVALTNDGVRFVLSQTNDEFWVHMERMASAAQGDALRKQWPLPRFGQPVDIADAVEFLAGPRSSWMTGQIMVVDEWPDRQSFQTFFETAQPQIGPMMREVASGEPQITFWTKLETHDDVGWES